MNPYRFSLSLRITHPTIKAAEVEERLGLVPGVAKSVGEKSKSPTGRELDGINKETFCTFRLSSGHDSTLRYELGRWTQALSKHRDYLGEFVKSGGTLEYFIGLFLEGNSGLELSPEEVSSIQRLGIGISLDIYPNQSGTD